MLTIGKVIVSEFNKLEGNRYFDPESQTSFELDHVTQVHFAVYCFGKFHGADPWCLDCLRGTIISLGVTECGLDVRGQTPSFDVTKANERIANPFRSLSPSTLANTTPARPTASILLRTTALLQFSSSQTATLQTTSGEKFHPAYNVTTNYVLGKLTKWKLNRNGRFRAIYQVPVSSSSTTVTGKIHVDVHYYEDGNVALNTSKPVNLSVSSVSAEAIISRIAAAERDYQEELNRAFVSLSEGAFKSLRRQLPITRQKVEWEKVGGYRLGQDISGGKGR